MTGTEMVPGDLHAWWHLGQSPRCPCPLCGKSQLQVCEEQHWTGSLELCGGLKTTPQTLIFVGGHPCSQPQVSIPLGRGIFLAAIPEVTPKPQQRIKSVKAV